MSGNGILTTRDRKLNPEKAELDRRVGDMVSDVFDSTSIIFVIFPPPHSHGVEKQTTRGRNGGQQ